MQICNVCYDCGGGWGGGGGGGVGGGGGGGGGVGFVLDVHDFWWWGEGSWFKGSFGEKLGSRGGLRMARLKAEVCVWSSVSQGVEGEVLLSRAR